MKIPALSILVSLVTLAAPVLRAESAPAADDARALAIGRAYLKYQEQLRALAPSGEDNAQWWRGQVSGGPTLTTEAREKFAKADREFRETIRPLLGTEVLSASGPDQRFVFLPLEKRERVARIEQNYVERRVELQRQTQNSRLPSDWEKLKALAADREREMLTVLTPPEFELLEMRYSTVSSMVRSRYGEAIESETEFRKLFALQKAFEEKFPIEAITYAARQLDFSRLRSEAERKLLEDVRAAVGPERFLVLRRMSDQEYITLKGLAKRLNLADTVPNQVMELRDNYASVSQAINNQTGISATDRRSLIQDVEKEARQKLTEILGKEGYEVFAGRASWLRYLEAGQAFGTDPKDATPGMSISSSTMAFPIYPPGTVIRTSSSGTSSTISVPASTPPPATASPSPTPRSIDPNISVQPNAK